MDHQAKKQLSHRFGERISFNKTERMLYSHDIAAMPKMIKPLVGNTCPQAVVQPADEKEIIDLVRWANEKGIDLVVRGAATSGYGGVLPVSKGMVIDMFQMDRILDIDEANAAITVQPGIIWEKLDRELKKRGLTLRLYPTSYPGSTVGGWLAQGGSGIGSYQWGQFRDNVISARAVLGDGTVREFGAQELDLISDAEGTTGIITQVKLKVMPLEEMEISALGFDGARDLQVFLKGAVREKVPLWSLLFINPQMAALKNKAPENSHQSGPAVLLPQQYIATLTYRKKDSQAVNNKLSLLLQESKGKMLDEEVARHEWENRFKVMVVKRISPSLVPAEFIIPLDALEAVLNEIAGKVKKPVIKEGLVLREGRGGRPEVVVLGFIPSDQRKFSYNFVFALTLTILKIAQKHGGRAYAAGLYFGRKAKQVLGEERLASMRGFKKKTDANGRLNPGKIFGSRLLDAAMGLAEMAEPLVRPLGNLVSTEIGERFLKPVRGIPADVAWYAYSCSQCGYCVPECDQFYGRGWESQSPRGRWYWLREYMEGRQKWDQQMVDSFLACTTCELCNIKCSVNLPIESSWMKLRGWLVQDQQRMTIPPFEMMAAALGKEGNIWAGYRKDRDSWFPEDLKQKHYNSKKKTKIAYFAGCTASYVEQDIAMATVRLLDEAGVDFNYIGCQENCCGTPMLVAGKWDLFAHNMQKNIQTVKEMGADTVVSSCPACDMMWRHVYPQWAQKMGIPYPIKAAHYSELVADRIQEGQFAFPENGLEPVTVTWHDSCHMGRVSGVYDAPRKLIEAIPNVRLKEMHSHGPHAHCCGSVLTLIKEPPVAAKVGKMRLDQAVEAGAEKVLALCPCCEFQFRVTRDKKNMDLDIVDLARFGAAALGYHFPEPDAEVQRQWAVFESMIQLMTPEGFAQIMQSMWPQLIEAMPFHMGPMMRFMGKVPGALKAMKPLFPILFPVLLPKMLPKVMDTMLNRVAERIPMPDYMEEQMAALMPQVMDNLMPHMVRDVIPLVADHMIAHLQIKG